MCHDPAYTLHEKHVCSFSKNRHMIVKPLTKGKSNYFITPLCRLTGQYWYVTPVPTEASRAPGEEVEICADPKTTKRSLATTLGIVWESEVFSFKHNAESVHTVENSDILCRYHFDLNDNLLTATTFSACALRYEDSVFGIFLISVRIDRTPGRKLKTWTWSFVYASTFRKYKYVGVERWYIYL